MLRTIIALALITALVLRLPAPTAQDAQNWYVIVQPAFKTQFVKKHGFGAKHLPFGQRPMSQLYLKPFRTKPFVPT